MATKITPRNIMEDLVENKLGELMRSADMCCCGRCRADAKALALNKLPPRYVVSVAARSTRIFRSSAHKPGQHHRGHLAAIRVVHQYPHHDAKYA